MATPIQTGFLIFMLTSSLSLGGSFIYVFAEGSGYPPYSPAVPDAPERVNRSRVLSELPIPEGFILISAQSAAYYDDSSGILHVWYGLREAGRGEEGNKILYTNTSDFQTWSEPLVVIELPRDGIRDPTIFIEDGQIYLFTQVYNSTTGRYHPIRLYRISKTGVFWDPSQYEPLGVVVDLGEPGEFDDAWVASFCLVKIDSVYYGAYEARSSDGTFTIGRTRAYNIEALPYIKEGQVLGPDGQAITNPISPRDAIVPCTFASPALLFIHYDKLSGPGEEWQARYLAGDFSKNSMKLSDGDLRPLDPYQQHNNICHIGLINGRYMFLMQSGDKPEDFKLRLYMEPPQSVGGWGEMLPRAEPIKQNLEHLPWLGTALALISPLIIGLRAKQRGLNIKH